VIPADASELEREARLTPDANEARELYATLARHQPTTPSGVRAALWLGRFLYDSGRLENALARFEAARKHASDSKLQAEAVFWCEQARLLSGHEPVAPEGTEPSQGFWGVMQQIVRIDREIQQGRKTEAEEALLGIEGAARREGLLGLCLARWGGLFRLPGRGRVGREDLRGWVSAAIDLPERLELEAFPVEPLPQETWTLVFGNYLDEAAALARQKELLDAGVSVRVVAFEQEEGHRYRVVLGPFTSEAEADSAAGELSGLTSADYHIQRTQ
jgi:hypothetical protein